MPRPPPLTEGCRRLEMTRPCDRRLSTLPAGPGCRLQAELLVHVPVTVDGGAAGTRGRPPPRQEQSPARESCPRLGAHFNGKQGRSAPSGARIVFRAIRERSAATAGAKSASRLPSPRLEQWGRDLSPSLAVLSSQERSKQWVQVGPSCPQQSLQVGGRKSGPTPASSQSRRWQQLLSASQQGSWAVLPGRGPLARPPPLRLRGLEVTGLGSSLESFVS